MQDVSVMEARKLSEEVKSEGMLPPAPFGYGPAGCSLPLRII